MNQKLKQLKLIPKMMVIALLVLFSILTTQTSAIAQPLTRAQIAVILGQGIHGSLYTPPAATGIFDDVSINDRAADWIEQLYKDGITSGCGQNPLRYCPTNPVTRDQMAIFLLRSRHGKNYKPPPATGIFDDVPVTQWAADWIEQLYREKITSGCCASPLRYCPDGSVTGLQTSLFIVRTFRLPAPVPTPSASAHASSTGDGKSVLWPDPRFTDNGDGTVTDHLTNLVWLKNANCFGEQSVNVASTSVGNLAHGQCGLSDGSQAGDWQMPTIRQLHSLVDLNEGWPALPPSNPFIDVQSARYLTKSFWPLTWCDDCLWVVRMGYYGVIEPEFPSSVPHYVWPLRVGN